MNSSTNPAELSRQVIRQAAVDTAWDRAIGLMPQLTLLGETGGSLKAVMANAIDNAMAGGVLDHDGLVEAALTRVPKLRSPNGVKSQLA